MASVKSGRNSEYGTPPPWRKQSETFGSRVASILSVWLPGARFRLDAPVRHCACSAGRVKRLVAAS